MSDVMVETRAALPPGAEASPAPRAPYVFSPSLVILSRPMDAPAEAIRSLRTYITVRHIQMGRRALAVCGTAVGAGCSFVSANLAVALSQVGVKTLLIDGNLRSPAIHAMIKPPETRPGLSECLAATDSMFNRYIDADVLENLSIMYAGHVDSQSPELLGGNRFRDIIEFCLREYAFTVVDTPPANTFADVGRIAGVVGYAAVVARRDATFVQDVKTLISQLDTDQTRVVGTVLNRA